MVLCTKAPVRILHVFDTATAHNLWRWSGNCSITQSLCLCNSACSMCSAIRAWTIPPTSRHCRCLHSRAVIAASPIDPSTMDSLQDAALARALAVVVLIWLGRTGAGLSTNLICSSTTIKSFADAQPLAALSSNAVTIWRKIASAFPSRLTGATCRSTTLKAPSKTAKLCEASWPAMCPLCAVDSMLSKCWTVSIADWSSCASAANPTRAASASELASIVMS